MGISLNKSVVEPTCDCCDNLVKYVLNGCKSECGLSKCCTCKIEVVNHNADDFVVEENIDQTKKQVLSSSGTSISNCIFFTPCTLQ